MSSKSYILLPLLIFSTFALASNKDTINLKIGKVFLGGNKYNRQIFLKNETVYQLTKFKHWELIDGILVTKDEKLLLIYHRTEKDKGYQLSILNLINLSITDSTYPGFGGSLYWTKNNRILLIWGCGTECTCFRIYDDHLKIISEECIGCIQEFIEDDILVSLPCLYADKGMFKIYSLNNGKIIKEKSFEDKYGEYFSWDVNMVSGVLVTKLRFDIKTDSSVTESIRF